MDLPKKSVVQEAGRGLALLAVLSVSAMLSPTASAQSATKVYRCDGPDGTPLFQNAPGKGCKLLDLPPINSVPADKLPVSPTAAGRSREGTKVGNGQQRVRDSDRRRILEDELAREQKRLEEVRTRYNDGEPERQPGESSYQAYTERVQRLRNELIQTEGNVSSLKREIDSLR
ncbi:MAG: DUF4124 domain-containing protein [Lautropia sp.]|nr:DUF4124 domain-containing protein [Lautropia sp.]